MSRRPVTAVAIPGAVVIVAVLSLCAPRGEPASAPSPSAAGASPTLAAASPTATASPSPTPQGLYLSKKLGYALDLGPTWHPAICGSSDPGKASLPATEQFTSAGPLEEYIGHVGSANDRVEVTVQDNPQRLSPMAFAARPEAVVTGTPRSVTFVGRPAAEVDSSGMGGERFAVYVADGDRMYAVLYRAERPASAPRPDLATMMRIIRSFRFVSAADLQALPDPTPIPAAAPTTQALAVLLATAFQQKDPAALERLLAPCVNYGVQNGGGGHRGAPHAVLEGPHGHGGRERDAGRTLCRRDRHVRALAVERDATGRSAATPEPGSAAECRPDDVPDPRGVLLAWCAAGRPIVD
jgi:hypothetical protein